MLVFQNLGSPCWKLFWYSMDYTVLLMEINLSVVVANERCIILLLTSLGTIDLKNNVWTISRLPTLDKICFSQGTRLSEEY